MAKCVTIIAFFPELKGGKRDQQGRGTGSTVQAAMSAAVRDLLHQPKLKAQRYSMFKATVSVGTVPNEGKETTDEKDDSDQQDQT